MKMLDVRPESFITATLPVSQCELIITFPDVLEGDHRHQALPVSGVGQCGEAHSVVCATTACQAGWTQSSSLSSS